MDALILLGSFVALILIGMPVAYALGLSALIGAWWIDIPFQALMIQIAGGVNKFSLMAIPFFVLAGAIMAEGGMSRRLVAFAGVLVGFVRGGLSLVNIMASTFFGAISGSSVADCSALALSSSAEAATWSVDMPTFLMSARRFSDIASKARPNRPISSLERISNRFTEMSPAATRAAALSI